MQYCHRFLHHRVVLRTRPLRPRRPGAQSAQSGPDAQGAPDAAEHDPRRTEHLRQRLQKWCDTAVEKITEELAELEMHSAVRNTIRLLDRIKDYEKRVVQHSGALGPEDLEALRAALGVLARLLIPFAPHTGEELWEASGLGEPGVAPPWPAPGEGAREAAEGDRAVAAAAGGEPKSAGIH